MQQAYAKLANARFALEGTNVYPDATFTLRLAFGVVKGYTQGGERIPPWTTLGGAYAPRRRAHDGRPPYALAASAGWIARTAWTCDTPLNFVSTADIIGGNSGSPVVNRAGELVGMIFDGNLPSLVWDFVYDDQRRPRHRRRRPGDPRVAAKSLRRRRAGRRTWTMRKGGGRKDDVSRRR